MNYRNESVLHELEHFFLKQARLCLQRLPLTWKHPMLVLTIWLCLSFAKEHGYWFLSQNLRLAFGMGLGSDGQKISRGSNLDSNLNSAAWPMSYTYCMSCVEFEFFFKFRPVEDSKIKPSLVTTWIEMLMLHCSSRQFLAVTLQSRLWSYIGANPLYVTVGLCLGEPSLGAAFAGGESGSRVWLKSCMQFSGRMLHTSSAGPGRLLSSKRVPYLDTNARCLGTLVLLIHTVYCWVAQLLQRSQPPNAKLQPSPGWWTVQTFEAVHLSCWEGSHCCDSPSFLHHIVIALALSFITRVRWASLLAGKLCSLVQP